MKERRRKKKKENERRRKERKEKIGKMHIQKFVHGEMRDARAGERIDLNGMNGIEVIGMELNGIEWN